MAGLTMLSHYMSAELKRQLTPDNYYDGCFGIMRMDDEPVGNIRIRAFYPELNYIEEMPLHESQQTVFVSDATVWSDPI